MPEFYFTIKGKRTDEHGVTRWDWPPVWNDIIEAADRKEARQKINKEYGKQFPMRVLDKDMVNNEFILNIHELRENDNHYRHLFKISTCAREGCGNQYKIIERYQTSGKGSMLYCSLECHNMASNDNQKGYYDRQENNWRYNACIYKITHKKTGKSYIGKTTQAFTFRWYQHFFQTSDTKFHRAIDGSKISDWSFEVIEDVQYPSSEMDTKAKEQFVLLRESYWISHFKSHLDEYGYNTLISTKEDPAQAKMAFINESE